MTPKHEPEHEHGHILSNLLKDIPQNPPRSPSLLPGLHYRAMITGEVIMGVFGITFLCVLFLLVFFSDKTFRMPFLDMQTTQGEVLESEFFSKRCGILLRYSFLSTDNAVSYGTQFVRDDSPYFSYKPGDRLSILYDTADPTFNHIDDGLFGKTERNLLLAILGGLAVGVSIFGATILAQVIPQIRARKLFSQGMMTTGTLFYVKEPKHSWLSPKTTKHEVFFTYDTQSGAHIESSITTENTWLLNQLPLGAPLTVMYLAETPKKSIILEFYVR